MVLRKQIVHSFLLSVLVFGVRAASDQQKSAEAILRELTQASIGSVAAASKDPIPANTRNHPGAPAVMYREQPESTFGGNRCCNQKCCDKCCKTYVCCCFD